MKLKKIYCCGCKESVQARLTNGEEVYPHLPTLSKRPQWVCDTCKNFVGTHWQTDNPTEPLGNIATKEIKKLRMLIHSKLDVIWKSNKMSRGEVYKFLTENLGHPYHTANIKHENEAKNVLKLITQLTTTTLSKRSGE